MRRVAPLMVLTMLVSSLHVEAIDIVPPETSIAERIGRADAVVLRVRAVSEPTVRAYDHAPAIRAANPDVPVSGPFLSPLIEQNVQVVEVIKGQQFASAGTTIRIGTSGGHNSMHLAESWQQRTLTVGADYVLFLTYDKWASELVYYYFDIFRLDSSGLVVPFDTEYGKTLQGLRPTAALTAIRDAAARGPAVPKPRAEPLFEEVSIQRNTSPDTNWRARHVPGQDRYENISARVLIGLTYSIDDTRVLNLPDWADTERYDVRASYTVQPSANASGLRQFGDGWHALLEERFALRVRREIRDMPVYVLERITDGVLGPGVRPSAVDCFVRPNRPSGCSQRSVPGLIQATGMDWGFLPDALGITDRPVIDRTGLRGPVDLRLEWTPASAGGVFDLVSVGNALEAQLGLRLRESAEPFEVLVVDRIERPADN